MTSLAVSPSKAPFHCPYSRRRLLKHQFTAFTRGTASKSAIFTAFPQAHGRAEAAAAAGEGGPPANEFTPATKAMWGEVYTLTYRRVDAAADGAAAGSWRWVGTCKVQAAKGGALPTVNSTFSFPHSSRPAGFGSPQAEVRYKLHLPTYNGVQDDVEIGVSEGASLSPDDSGPAAPRPIVWCVYQY